MATVTGTLVTASTPSAEFIAYRERFDLSIVLTENGTASGTKIQLQRNVGNGWRLWKEYTASAEEVITTSGAGRAYRLTAGTLEAEADDAANFATVAYAFGDTY